MSAVKLFARAFLGLVVLACAAYSLVFVFLAYTNPDAFQQYVELSHETIRALSDAINKTL